MKKVLSISFLSLATLTLLMLTIIPHHHHGEYLCVAIECCGGNSDNCCSHPSDSSEHSHGNCHQDESSCVVKTPYLTQQSTFQFKNNNNADNTTQAHLFLPVILFQLLISLEPVEYEPDYGEYLITYTSLNATSVNGLRAPPCLLI